MASITTDAEWKQINGTIVPLEQNSEAASAAHAVHKYSDDNSTIEMVDANQFERLYKATKAKAKRYGR
eukprot:SAG11_NODE_4141_length_2042_cov_6.759650_1_plen_68_part_00